MKAQLLKRTGYCYGCDAYFPEVVEVGEEQGVESATTSLCEYCAKEAAALFEQGREG